jgi:hypothetical protein
MCRAADNNDIGEFLEYNPKKYKTKQTKTNKTIRIAWACITDLGLLLIFHSEIVGLFQFDSASSGFQFP